LASERPRILAAFVERDIEVRTYYDPPVHLHRAFAAARAVSGLPATRDLSSRMLSLPMFNSLSEAEIEWIVSTFSLIGGGTARP
ncbi:MAG: DegT/DnrJ/EryC1/StrS family aminotransferase, partial [Acidimicrobiales bacterium]